MPGLQPEDILVEITEDGHLIMQGDLRGLLKLGITATPDADPSLHLARALTINCEVGPDVPASVVEGIRVNVYDVINFNKPVEGSGANIYVAQ